jgi:AcrR family transcriptional regulator
VNGSKSKKSSKQKSSKILGSKRQGSAGQVAQVSGPATSGSSWRQVPAPRRLPTQARARETVRAILQAAAEVIAEYGYAAGTTNRIAARAGVSIGSLYQYFPNKDAILVALHEQHRADVEPIITEFMARLDDPAHPLAETFQAMFTQLVDLHLINPRLMQVLAEEVPRPPQVREHHRTEHRYFVEELARILGKRPEVRLRSLIMASHVIVKTTESLSYWLVHEAPDSLDSRAFIDEAVDLLVGYMQGRGSRD